MEQKNKVIDGIEKRKRRVKQALASRLKPKEDVDIFDIINEKLASNKVSATDLKEKERKQLKVSMNETI